MDLIARRLVLAVALVVCNGCPGKTPDGPGASSAPTAPPPTTRSDEAPPPASADRARPGHLVGTILDARGSPIAAPAKAVVSVAGIGLQSGQEVTYRPAVKPDGTYEARLTEGTYHPVQATVEVAFGGSTYHLELEPVQDNTADRDSAAGIVQDFVWKLTGPHVRYAANPDPKNHTHWYGCSIGLRPSLYRNDLKRPTERAPAGTRYVFTLEPTGPLADGSQARAVTFERAVTTPGELEHDGRLHDIPLGTYTLTGVEVAADGARRPLVFETSYATFEPAARIVFPARGVGHTPDVPLLEFDRQ